MKINLRIVGIFYTNTVIVGGNKNTVKDVLDVAVSEPGKNVIFNYTSHVFHNKESICSFSAKYTSEFRSPITERPYPAGLYSISEDLNGYPVYSAWQYYIFDKKNVYKNRGNGGVPFNKAYVVDGDSIVWRLLNIHAPVSQKETPASPKLEKLFAE